MEYAQARMQARHGAAPGEALWQRLGSQDSLPAYLGAARETALGGWLGGIGDRADAHHVELALRQRWREAVAELARWMPLEWQPAVRWSAGLVDLPALAWLAAGGVPQPWMARDPALAAHLSGDAASLSAGREAWLQAWRQSWPSASDEDGQALARLVEALQARLGGLTDRPVGADLRGALGRDAARCFRRLAGRPPVAFAYLLLVALDLERLRAELVLRALKLESVR